eukprot:TRINITY_DN15119_c0_g1_i2.p2 TRINITY_DN15119_c0_g1~~TRINITY_DN15119_c0_g1_i2.p2  ORF type:complete len:394 (+),score=73.23 TRINITY_DN15119_c0_g1_i2:71-1183(+)
MAGGGANDMVTELMLRERQREQERHNRIAEHISAQLRGGAPLGGSPQPLHGGSPPGIGGSPHSHSQVPPPLSASPAQPTGTPHSSRGATPCSAAVADALRGLPGANPAQEEADRRAEEVRHRQIAQHITAQFGGQVAQQAPGAAPSAGALSSPPAESARGFPASGRSSGVGALTTGGPLPVAAGDGAAPVAGPAAPPPQGTCAAPYVASAHVPQLSSSPVQRGGLHSPPSDPWTAAGFPGERSQPPPGGAQPGTGGPAQLGVPDDYDARESEREHARHVLVSQHLRDSLGGAYPGTAAVYSAAAPQSAPQQSYYAASVPLGPAQLSYQSSPPAAGSAIENERLREQERHRLIAQHISSQMQSTGSAGSSV